MVKLLYTDRDETFYVKLVSHVVLTVVSDHVCIVAAKPFKEKYLSIILEAVDMRVGWHILKDRLFLTCK